MECPSSVSIQELREACDCFIVPFNESTVRTTNLCKNYVCMYVCTIGQESFAGLNFHELYNFTNFKTKTFMDP